MKTLHLAVLTLVLIYVSGCYSTESEKTGLEGKPMPSFTLMRPDSSNYSNSKDLIANNPAVLFYYSPNCPYCRAQLKGFIKEMDELKDIRFYLVTQASYQSMKEFDKEYGLNKYQNIINGKDIDNKLATYFEVTAVPVIAVYGKDKKLTKLFQGKTYNSLIKKAAFH
ncbi:hypothetical protein A3860_31545 [Niastella vici]|uniref:Thioredoxin domain-containing protein n=1 Tax=Niastella vici TaxID=1703345 RepID=A0A1V9FTW5_9BACT|nr:redoxin domain-containing protein [Niastella vici]OQP61795.1 hypothetical protein A3860_31545 [Niastella vici]